MEYWDCIGDSVHYCMVLYLKLLLGKGKEGEREREREKRNPSLCVYRLLVL